MGYSIYTKVSPKVHASILDYFTANFVPYNKLFPKETSHTQFVSGKDLGYKSKPTKSLLGFNYSSGTSEGEKSYTNGITALISSLYGPLSPAGSFGQVPIMCYDGFELWYIINKDNHPHSSVAALYKQLHLEKVDSFIVNNSCIPVLDPTDPLTKFYSKLVGMKPKDQIKISNQLEEYRQGLIKATGLINVKDRPTTLK